MTAEALRSGDPFAELASQVPPSSRTGSSTSMSTQSGLPPLPPKQHRSNGPRMISLKESGALPYTSSHASLASIGSEAAAGSHKPSSEAGLPREPVSGRTSQRLPLTRSWTFTGSAVDHVQYAIRHFEGELMAFLAK